MIDDDASHDDDDDAGDAGDAFHVGPGRFAGVLENTAQPTPASPNTALVWIPGDEDVDVMWRRRARIGDATVPPDLDVSTFIADASTFTPSELMWIYAPRDLIEVD